MRWGDAWTASATLRDQGMLEDEMCATYLKTNRGVAETQMTVHRIIDDSEEIVESRVQSIQEVFDRS